MPDARSIVDAILSDWQKLCDDNSRTESDYHSYLAKHAGFFLSPSMHTSVVISKIKLSSELETDFVVATDQQSLGFRYEFIEIESPHAGSLTRGRDYSARLTHAVRQVNDWQNWLKNHPPEAKELFPSKDFILFGEPNFHFSIYIGRRETERRYTHLRNRYGRKLGIDIRSFDAFSDHLKGKGFTTTTPVLPSAELKRLGKYVRNSLANPFFTAYSHAEWVSIVKDPDFNRYAHMIAENARLLLAHRKYNDRLKDFLTISDALPQKEKQRIQENFLW